MSTMQYPKWVYRRDAEGKVEGLIVPTIEAHRTLGASCFESPADVPPMGTVLVPVSQSSGTETPATVLTTTPTPAAAIVRPNEAEIQKFYASPVKTITDRIATLESVAELSQIVTIEEQRPGGIRKRIILAVSKRVAELTATATPDDEDEDEADASPVLSTIEH